MRIAIVHDDLVQWGGAERVLLGLCEIFPEAPIYTSVCDYNNSSLLQKFVNKKIVTSFLQKIPGWKSLYKTLLPLYPIAFEQFNFDKFDLVISHTTRFAKSIITKPHTKHICYCHTPPRFLWHFSGYENYGIGELLMSKLRVYDQVSSNRVDYFLAGSENAQRRIRKIYRRDSKVVYPFVDLERFKNVETFDGRYFVVISRLNKYKRVDLAIKACRKIGANLKIIGDGPEIDYLGKIASDTKVEFVRSVDDNTLALILSGAKALIIPAIEDFGITSLEAQALGKPVIAFREGGVLETVVEGKTGIFFDKQDENCLAEVLKDRQLHGINSNDCRKNVLRFEKRNFMQNFKTTVATLL